MKGVGRTLTLTNNALAAYVLLALVATSLAGQFLSLRVVSLSLVLAIMGGAYGAKAALAIAHSIDPALALTSGSLCGIVVGCLGAAIDSLFTGRSRYLALLASLGFMKVMQGAVTAVTGGSIEVLPLQFGGIVPTGNLLATPRWLPLGLVLVAVCAGTQALLLCKSRLGIAALAVGDDPVLACLFGIPARKVQITIQSIGGGIAGLAGVLMAAESGLRPDLGMIVALKAFALLIAARGRLSHVFVWALLLVASEQCVGYVWGGQLRETVGLAFLVVVLAARLNRKVTIEAD